MSNKINKLIETICSEGCTSVNSVIKTLENGEDTHYHEEPLSAAERIQIIKELKEIMHVYNKR